MPLSLSRRNFLLASAASAMLPSVALQAAAAASSIPRVLPAGKRVLFLDDFMVESLQHARQAMNPPVKVAENPVVRSDRPWEGKTIAEVTVFYDEDLKQFRMWYPVYDYHPPIPPAILGRQDDPKIADIANEYKKCTACYAVSDDGIHWEKPELGLVEFHGSKANNIVMGSGPDARGHFSTGHIFRDPVEPDPQRRYKALKSRMIPHGDGQERMVIDLYSSPDGFVWTQYAGNPVFDLQRPGSWGPTSYMGWDPIREVYAVYMENCGHQRCPVGKRLIGRSESPDLIHWSPPDTVLVPDDIDGPGVEPYALHPCVYEDLYVGYVWIHTLAKHDHYPQLVFSRDGSRWDRRYREATMARGELPAFDGNSVLPLKPIVHGDRIFIYYLASNYRELYQFEALGAEQAQTSIGLATLPRDGFACLQNDGPDRGELVTRSLQFSGRRLHVNCEMTGAAPGAIKVELMEPNYFPIEGCSMDAAAPLTTTSTDHVVTWNGNADIGHLAGRTIKLRMSVANAKLFSFWFTD